MRWMHGVALILCVGYLLGAIIVQGDITYSAVFLAAWMIMTDNEWLHREKK